MLEPSFCEMIPSLLAMVLFAVSSVSARRSVGIFGPATANFFRQILAVLLLVAFVLMMGSGFSGPSLSWFLWSGVVGYGLGDAGVFLALPRLGSRLTSLMTQCLAAPIGALLEWAWRGQVPTGVQLVAGCTILAGVFLALAPQRGSAWAGVEWKSGAHHENKCHQQQNSEDLPEEIRRCGSEDAHRSTSAHR